MITLPTLILLSILIYKIFLNTIFVSLSSFMTQIGIADGLIYMFDSMGFEIHLIRLACYPLYLIKSHYTSTQAAIDVVLLLTITIPTLILALKFLHTPYLKSHNYNAILNVSYLYYFL